MFYSSDAERDLQFLEEALQADNFDNLMKKLRDRGFPQGLKKHDRAHPAVQRGGWHIHQKENHRQVLRDKDPSLHNIIAWCLEEGMQEGNKRIGFRM
jgi:hypothetical protein